MKASETKITIGGVFRCCFDFTGEDDKEYQFGDERTCLHCKEKFRLLEKDGEAVWTPLWQIKIE